MERMPYHPELGVEAVSSLVPRSAERSSRGDWRTGLPTLSGSLVVLRELRASDAASLFAAVTCEAVTRFISPPPATVEGVERFVAWSHRQRDAGQYICFAVIPRGLDRAVGLFQLRSMEPDFGTAEWGFAIAPEFWGTGLFVDGARLMMAFAFDGIGSHRLEARAAVTNSRGNAALKKLGAVHEGVLRRSFLRNGESIDQSLWTVIADDWRDAQSAWGSPIIH